MSIKSNLGSLIRESVGTDTTLIGEVNDDSSQNNHNTKSRLRGRRKLSKISLNSANLFREEVSGYPEEEIKLILKQTPDAIKELYNVLNSPLDPNMNLTERTAYRQDDESLDSSKDSVCRSVIRNIYPREATKDNSPVYVPNDEDFVQVIQAEICQNANSECSYLRDNLPYGMISECQQKYAYKKLLYLDPLEKRMASDLFSYPSCCSCYVMRLRFDLRSSSSGTTPNTLKSSANNRDTDPAIDKPSVSDLKDSAISKSQLPAIGADTALLNSYYKLPPINKTLVVSDDDTGANKLKAKEQDIDHLERTTAGPKRQSKALPVTGGNTMGNLEDQQSKSATSTDERIVKRPGPPSGAANTTQAVIPPRSNSAQTTGNTNKMNSNHTVVLQEDKVYTPNIEN